ncbi:hypothetical protein FHX15_005995 [Rhizobium sp. BK650]|uniref:hypothetical protein n=1 Tax=Rhizobium sp. BK650 TaxID=2586990 RepID=UPI0016120C84|nr:hypothetical protein [Rhizobium sp. BK650]MBB3660724.1 hypothetical protein [Rhizobium sp. BK650]
MRSPWQLIKGLASRRKIEDATAPADRTVETVDTSTREFEEAHPPVDLPKAVPENDTTARDAGSEIRQTGDLLEHRLPLPADPSSIAGRKTKEVIPDNNGEVQGIMGSRSDIIAKGSPSAAVASTRTSRRKHGRSSSRPGVPSESPAEPIAVAETPVAQAIALDLEINELRSRLSERLRQQNRQLRKLLDRYDRY